MFSILRRITSDHIACATGATLVGSGALYGAHLYQQNKCHKEFAEKIKEFSTQKDKEINDMLITTTSSLVGNPSSAWGGPTNYVMMYHNRPVTNFHKYTDDTMESFNWLISQTKLEKFLKTECRKVFVINNQYKNLTKEKFDTSNSGGFCKHYDGERFGFITQQTRTIRKVKEVQFGDKLPNEKVVNGEKTFTNNINESYDCVTVGDEKYTVSFNTEYKTLQLSLDMTDIKKS